MTPPRIDLPQFGPNQGEPPRRSQAPASSSTPAQSPPGGRDFPVLPRTKRPVLSSHRHDANPAMALKVLQDIHQAVEGWHQELRQLVKQIQDLYLEGPIVEGWLEAVPQNQAASSGLDAAVLRHADPQDLQGYVTQRWGDAGGEGAPASAPAYRLCQLDADGQMHCQPCPPEQLSYITMAVARHQRLRQYLSQKQYLEARLKRAVEALTRVRGELDIAPSQETL